MKLSHAIAAGICLIPGALAWGSFGHITVGFLASQLVSQHTETYFQGLLHNNTEAYLAGIATWADVYGHTPAGRFTSTFHFIDAHDNPPASCNVDMARDCKATGCVVGALANYTTRLLDTRLAPTERVQALKFVVHFVGDMHQPLHNEDAKRGGNDIFVKFDGNEINLHKVWDSKILDTVHGGIRREYVQAEEWAGDLVKEIKTGKFKAASGSWAAAVSLEDPEAMGLAWSREGNAYICTDVLPQGPVDIVRKEIGRESSYFKAAVPIIEIQIARAGFRLAALLDKIATAATAAGAIDEL